MTTSHQRRPECVTCHLIEAANQTETEVNLFLAKHEAEKVSRINGEEASTLPKVLTYRGCLYNEAHFSKGLGHFVVDCRGPDVPQVRLYNGATLQEESHRHLPFALQTRAAICQAPLRLWQVGNSRNLGTALREHSFGTVFGSDSFGKLFDNTPRSNV